MNKSKECQHQSRMYQERGNQDEIKKKSRRNQDEIKTKSRRNQEEIKTKSRRNQDEIKSIKTKYNTTTHPSKRPRGPAISPSPIETLPTRRSTWV